MNGLKVYLRSRTTQLYIYAQPAIGFLLIVNALREYHPYADYLTEIIVNIVAGLLLMLGFTIPKRWRRHLRYVPGILIALGGLALYWITDSSGIAAYHHLNKYITFLSYGLFAFGMLQPLLDPRHFAYFQKKGVRYRFGAFSRGFANWQDVLGISYFDSGFELALKNGKTYRMLPYNAESQNLRLYIDQMLHAGKHEDAEEEKAPEKPLKRAMVSA